MSKRSNYCGHRKTKTWPGVTRVPVPKNWRWSKTKGEYVRVPMTVKEASRFKGRIVKVSLFPVQWLWGRVVKVAIGKVFLNIYPGAAGTRPIEIPLSLIDTIEISYVGERNKDLVG